MGQKRTLGARYRVVLGRPVNLCHTVEIYVSHNFRRLTFVFSHLLTSASVRSSPGRAFAMGLQWHFVSSTRSTSAILDELMWS